MSDELIKGRFFLDVTQPGDGCHQAADAFWKYWQENGETHKHGYYESTWSAINAAINIVGIWDAARSQPLSRTIETLQRERDEKHDALAKAFEIIDGLKRERDEARLDLLTAQQQGYQNVLDMDNLRDQVARVQRERDEAQEQRAEAIRNFNTLFGSVTNKEIVRLRTAIKDIIEHPDYTNPEGMVRRLRDALKGEGDDS